MKVNAFQYEWFYEQRLAVDMYVQLKFIKEADLRSNVIKHEHGKHKPCIHLTLQSSDNEKKRCYCMLKVLSFLGKNGGLLRVSSWKN